MRRPGEAERSAADFTALYEARFVDLAGQLYAFTGDNSETYDLVQEAFIRAWQRWATVGKYEDPVAWVRRVAWNLAMSRYRRLQRSRSMLRDVSQVAPGMEPDRVALVAALRTLPEQHRRAVVLHYLADLSVTEIAVETGAAVGTVKSWLHRGRVQLAAALQIHEGVDR
ncbi:SigE family RNA polymerase sigma factor [Dactylosporangium sp. NPDC005555]|uniref:RNA polymerase sigma factor n=1 Tax=Dactylosporangium sp. NPDC005555 TaxID=3154889 RepID=UPI0033BF87CE